MRDPPPEGEGETLLPTPGGEWTRVCWEGGSVQAGLQAEKINTFIVEKKIEKVIFIKKSPFNEFY